MPNGAYLSRFCHMGLQSVLLIAISCCRRFVENCIENVFGRKRSSCNTTTCSPTVLVCVCVCVCVERIERNNCVLLAHPPYILDLTPSDQHVFGFVNDQMRGQQYVTNVLLVIVYELPKCSSTTRDLHTSRLVATIHLS